MSLKASNFPRSESALTISTASWLELPPSFPSLPQIEAAVSDKMHMCCLVPSHASPRNDCQDRSFEATDLAEGMSARKTRVNEKSKISPGMMVLLSWALELPATVEVRDEVNEAALASVTIASFLVLNPPLDDVTDEREETKETNRVRLLLRIPQAASSLKR